MGVKLAHALGAEVTVLSQSLSKKDDGMRLGADYFYATSNPETFKHLRGSFDLIINTVSAELDWNLYLNLLKRDGTMVVVDNARKLISKTVDVTVTSVLQTTAGKMIFGRYDDRMQVVREVANGVA